MRKNLKIHFAVDDVTNKELLKVSKKSGLSKSELVRFAVNQMFSPEWIRAGKVFEERFDEIFHVKTSGGGSSARP